MAAIETEAIIAGIESISSELFMKENAELWYKGQMYQIGGKGKKGGKGGKNGGKDGGKDGEYREDSEDFEDRFEDDEALFSKLISFAF